MVIGFDWDGTLVRSFTAEPLPGVREKLHALPAGARTFIATNQGGPAFRAVLGDATYPTAMQIALNLIDGCAALNWRPDLLLVCTHPGKDGDEWERAAYQAARDLERMLRTPRQRAIVSPYPTWRKPAPGMLLRAADLFIVEPAELLFIGDLESDAEAARAAGARFSWAQEWLKDGLL